MIDQAADISHIFAMAYLVNVSSESRPAAFNGSLTLHQLFLPHATPRFRFPVLSIRPGNAARSETALSVTLLNRRNYPWRMSM